MSEVADFREKRRLPGGAAAAFAHYLRHTGPDRGPFAGPTKWDPGSRFAWPGRRRVGFWAYAPAAITTCVPCLDRDGALPSNASTSGTFSWGNHAPAGSAAASACKSTKTTCANPSRLGGSPFKSVGLTVRTLLSREIAERCGLLLAQ